MRSWRACRASGATLACASCQVLDTLALARELHPGQRNNLDALCKRYDVDNSRRELHGALLDARILADVYLAMTGGQGALALGESPHCPRTPATVRVTVRAPCAGRAPVRRDGDRGRTRWRTRHAGSDRQGERRTSACGLR